MSYGAERILNRSSFAVQKNKNTILLPGIQKKHAAQRDADTNS